MYIHSLLCWCSTQVFKTQDGKIWIGCEKKRPTLLFWNCLDQLSFWNCPVRVSAVWDELFQTKSLHVHLGSELRKFVKSSTSVSHFCFSAWISSQGCLPGLWRSALLLCDLLFTSSWERRNTRSCHGNLVSFLGGTLGSRSLFGTGCTFSFVWPIFQFFPLETPKNKLKINVYFLWDPFFQ